jgi:hypothetical protein
MIEFYGGYQDYSESGIDLTLLRQNQTLLIEERLRNNIRMLPLLEALSESAHASRILGSKQFQMPELRGGADILRQLADHQVEYVLVGNWAMVAQGADTATQNMAICYSRTARNMAALARALVPLHPRLRGAPSNLPLHFDLLTIHSGKNFTLTTDWGDVDLLSEVPGIGDYRQVYAQSDERVLFNFPVLILSLDALIAAKKAAGTTKDRNQLLELEQLKQLCDAAP